MAKKPVTSLRISKEAKQKLRKIGAFHTRSDAEQVEFMILQEYDRIERLKRVVSTDVKRNLEDCDDSNDAGTCE